MNKDNINMSELYPSGYLEVIIGPMFSSKTTRLVEVYKQCQFCNISVAVINHSIDNRYDDDLMSTHDKLLLKNNKQVYVCGLDGDFERKKFGQILDIIPLCDKVTKLTSLCSLCKDGTLGIFSMRLTNEKEQTVVGSDNYIPVCRICYSKKN